MPEPTTVIGRLRDVTNAHNLDALVACFADDYRLEMPVHPARGFVGSDQVRRNWTQIFAAVPDIAVDVLRTATAGDEVWSEWEMRGTRVDGSAHLMRGVFITAVEGDRIVSGRFYLEPVDVDPDGMDAAVRRLVGGEPR
jgi:ketosteroid isomerase-like protein